MKHKVIFLAILLMVLFIPKNVLAYGVPYTAPSGQTIYYKAVNNSVKITFPGNNAYSAWNNYTKPTGDLIIPDTIMINGNSYPVTGIDEYAFYECGGLTSVTLPVTVTSIGSAAFCFCTGLTSVIIPSSVTTIGNAAFAYVINVIYSGTATGGPWGAFVLNGFIENDFVFSDTAKTVLVKYYGNDSVINIPNTVSNIGHDAFSGNTGIQSVMIPSSVTDIDYYAFSGCSNLLSINIPNSVTSIEYGAFRDCGGLTLVTIGNSVSYLGQGVFWGCIGLTSIALPGSLTSTGTHTFYNCSNLSSVSLPNTINSIDSCAFYGCTNLASIEIPSAVTYIGNNAFEGCSGLTTIYSRAAEAPTLGAENTAFYGVDTSVNVIVPCGSLLSYVTRWVQFSNFTDTIVYHFIANSTNMSMGDVDILSPHSCQSPTTTFFADAVCDFQFDHWSDGDTNNPRTLTLISDTILVAYFVPRLADTITVYDTSYVYISVHDTTLVHDTSYINVPYTIHDTTIVHDTISVNVPYAVHDTTYINVYVNDTAYVAVHDTTYITQTDTVTNTVYDTITNTVFDTITNTVYDTTLVYNTDTLWLHDTVFVHDTIYIYDTIYVGVDEVETVSAKIYMSNGRIVVDGSQGNTVCLYDISGRILATKQDECSPLHFDVPASGAYLVKIGNCPARKVVIIR